MNKRSVGDFYKELLVEFRKSDKEGNRLVYKYSYDSLSKFTGSSLDFPFSSIDVAWLKRYEEWLIKRKCKGTTLSVLFRTDVYKRQDRYLVNRVNVYGLDNGFRVNITEKSNFSSQIRAQFMFGAQHDDVRLYHVFEKGFNRVLRGFGFQLA